MSWPAATGPERTLFLFGRAGHGDEGDGEECGVLKTRVGAPDQHQALGVLLAQGQDQPPAEGELIQEPLRKGSHSAAPALGTAGLQLSTSLRPAFLSTHGKPRHSWSSCRNASQP